MFNTSIFAELLVGGMMTVSWIFLLLSAVIAPHADISLFSRHCKASGFGE